MKKTSEIFGIPFSRFTLAEAVDRCGEIIEEGTPRHVLTANADFLHRCAKDREQRWLLLGGDEILCDGMPLVWASKLFGGESLPERVAGSDLVPELLKRCARKGHSVYFLGSDEATLEKLRAKLSRDLPALKIAGATSPPFGDVDDWDNGVIVEDIRRARADVLLVALGFPKQDKWIRLFRDAVGVPLSIGVGASLDFLVQKQVRAPRWMRRTGLEWLWRFAHEPRRLFARYLGDFFSLTGAAAKQLAWETYRRLPVLLPRASGRSAMLNGVSLGDAEVTSFTPDGNRTVSGASSGGAMICDLSGIETCSAGVTAEISRLCSRAIRERRPLAFFNPSKRLRFWLQLFGMTELFAVFESPLAVKSFARFEFVSFEVPAEPNGRRKAILESTVAEIAGAYRFIGSRTLVADASGIAQLTRGTARWLGALHDRLRSGGSALQLAGASDVTLDLMGIFGFDRVAK